MNKEHEIVLYQIDKTIICVSAFYREEELDEKSTTEFFSVVQKEENRNVTRNVRGVGARQ